jgi:hypothetical protein
MKTLLATIALALAGSGRDYVRGEYLEARTCDVFVGACYANSELGEAGKQATLAWRITEGKWKGTDLAGVAAVALVDAKHTLGDPYHSPKPVRNVLLLDEKATDAQLVALRDFVKTRLGDLAGEVVEERLVAIELKVDCCKEKGCAKLTAGDVVKIETRCLGDNDKVCGHEDAYYPPLSDLNEKLPAYTVQHQVKRTLLEREWDDRESRSAFLGKFEFQSPRAAKKGQPTEIATTR